ncbi:hypothetical protein [uncultured phage cr60_1]|uniref:Uncharacterized protein n=1 Tax=uncultured phage cr60_1 TaxID=2772082 RepID=A0A7M1RR62_9CAUD|nr:hypothetical protein KNV49_gp62 [uncultured phage cr60_1]QOR56935.1 hypothetical protein [uncultured phage cr60_1]
MGEVEKRDVVLENLREKYPEDLNKDYNCYWWCTCDTDGSALTYYLSSIFIEVLSYSTRTFR